MFKETWVWKNRTSLHLQLWSQASFHNALVEIEKWRSQTGVCETKTQVDCWWPKACRLLILKIEPSFIYSNMYTYSREKKQSLGPHCQIECDFGTFISNKAPRQSINDSRIHSRSLLINMQMSLTIWYISIWLLLEKRVIQMSVSCRSFLPIPYWWLSFRSIAILSMERLLTTNLKWRTGHGSTQTWYYDFFMLQETSIFNQSRASER